MSPVGLCAVSAAVLTALVPLTAVVAHVDPRRLDGVSVWRKPLKFEASLAIFFATVAWAVEELGGAVRDNGILWGATVAAAVSALFEMVYIIARAARAEHSHFNRTTPFSAAMYALMAIGAVLISLLMGVVALLAAVSAESPSLLRLGVSLGFGVSCIATLITGFAMGGPMRRHVGRHDATAGLQPLTGWSRSAGDLRVSHFVANHTAQLVVASAWLGQYAAPPIGAAVVCAIALSCVWLIVFTLRRALAGMAVSVLGLRGVVAQR